MTGSSKTLLLIPPSPTAILEPSAVSGVVGASVHAPAVTSNPNKAMNGTITLRINHSLANL
jgi:hypothetical protein